MTAEPARPSLLTGDLDLPVTSDTGTVTPEWTPTDRPRIEGVSWKEVRSVVTGDGRLTELWRRDWELDGEGAEQVFARVLAPRAVTAWHVHLDTTDRLACPVGDVLVVLYDARNASPSRGAIAEFRLGEHRPMTLSVPPGVLHGVQSIGPTSALLINTVDRAYRYDTPDHHRAPPDTPHVPYRFR